MAESESDRTANVEPTVTHKLKTWPEVFQAVWDGLKTAEFRKDDRGFKVGHWLQLNEYDPESGMPTGRGVETVITHIANDPRFGIPEGYVMLSFAQPIMRSHY